MTFFTSDQVEKLSSSTVKIDFLVKMEFVSETVYLWNGEYPLTVLGNVYKPLHGIGTIEGLGQSSTTQSESITLRVSGVPDQDPDLLALSLEETPEANQQLITIYLQLFDDEWQPIGSPITIWWGFMQPPRVEMTPIEGDEGNTQQISITAENAFFNRARPAYGRCTDRDQQKRYSGDKFFQFTPSLLQKTFVYPDY